MHGWPPITPKTTTQWKRRGCCILFDVHTKTVSVYHQRIVVQSKEQKSLHCCQKNHYHHHHLHHNKIRGNGNSIVYFNNNTKKKKNIHRIYRSLNFFFSVAHSVLLSVVFCNKKEVTQQPGKSSSSRGHTIFYMINQRE